MKNLYFGLMCILDSMTLLIIAIALTVMGFEPLKSFLGAVTMWEEVGTGLLGLTIALLIGSAIIAIVKSLFEEKKDEKETAE